MKIFSGLASFLILSRALAQNQADPALFLNPCEVRCEGNIFRKTFYVNNYENGICNEDCVRFPRAYTVRGYSCGRCPKAFENYNELKQAVDEYLADNSASSPVATLYGHPIGKWQVQKVGSFEYLFDGKRNTAAATFNEDISAWNVRAASNMQYMFASNTAFNKDIGAWNVAKVTTMEGMFEDASSFNRNIGSWDVTNVRDMAYMFYGAKQFNQNLNSWDVSNVSDMSFMFSSAESFNSPLDNWNVVNVRDFEQMFAEATAFSQDLCQWGDEMTSITSDEVINMFISTQCLLEDDPALSETPVSPLCFNCRMPGGV
ncbi:hypothetical protein FisN_13Hh208 [Fistulifera solaris]|uniref:BspA family leucine-rich repeat surface protein n=1 Tax=Fistulifera solaris TaxID=1519565 RepID=A0A1Z5KN33_FISSO|nr:hypothetical protein FisN_13Hh208 [Fistulifera solaris]|eukprot:GAX27696.1 hypothetical protein FisN_13Hh208 [Fistulifera solaris]